MAAAPAGEWHAAGAAANDAGRSRPIVEALHTWLTDVLERIVTGRTKATELETLLRCAK